MEEIQFELGSLAANLINAYLDRGLNVEEAIKAANKDFKAAMKDASELAKEAYC